MNHRKTHGLHRSRYGIVFGVCRGIADYFDISAFWLRIFAVAAFMISGVWPALVVYVFLALLLKKEPRGRWIPDF